MIDFYTAATPNGWKVSMALEELEVDYDPRILNLAEGDQRSPEFLTINPNGRIPAIVDRSAGNLAIFESGAILIYLAEKAGRLLPTDTAGRFNVLQWLMFQMAGIGPMQGQAVVFVRYFPQTVEPAIKRYINETRRLYEVLDTHLADHQYLAGDYSIADIANYSWVRSHKWARVSVDDLPYLQRWMAALAERPGIQRGIQVPPSPGKAELVKKGGSAITTQ